MRIQHNITAMNAYRNYNTNTKALAGNLEKLSSGYKINRAGDDAAGLAISEKMRAQITGLDAAQKNVKDGISLVKTAEGAMQEIQDMLNRMDYLATQSANGTYQDEVDRENLQKEVTALKTEINRIADSANFNGIKLLDGSISERGAGSKTTTVTGIDRIIKSTLSEGDVAHEVAGQKTILEEVGNATGTQGVVKINLTALQLSNTATSAEDVEIKIDIEGTELVLTYTGAAASATSDTIFSNLTLDSSYATSSTDRDNAISINGVDWYVGWSSSDKTLTLTMFDPPTTASQAQTNFGVKVTAGNDNTGIKYATNVGVHTATVPKVKGGGNAANTVFEIKESDIVDGAVIRIGNKKVTLAVGADSKVDTSNVSLGGSVADLTMMEEGSIDLNTALQAISNAFGTEAVMASGVNAKGAAGSRGFYVGVNDGKNGDPIGLTVQATSAPSSSGQMYFNTLDKLASIFSITSTQTWKKSDGLTLQIGDTADSFNLMKVSVGDMHTDSMGIADIDIGTQAGAQSAVQTIRDAINYVSSVRGDLGAVQNRLEHTGNNLAVMAENIQDAESTIRDTDVANEMMSYVKNNILVQSAQAMLAQANQLPQGVLQLLG